MGCDIHSYAEVKKNGAWEKVGDVFPLDDYDKQWYKKDYGDSPFVLRNYSLFAWLADVRNYSHIIPIDFPRGLPQDISTEVLKHSMSWGEDGHSHSWFSLDELLGVCYEGIIWVDMTLRDFIGENYFNVLDVLKTLGDPKDVRVVFWFDN